MPKTAPTPTQAARLAALDERLSRLEQIFPALTDGARDRRGRSDRPALSKEARA